MVVILTDKSSPDLICLDAWNDKVPLGNTFLLFLLSYIFGCNCFLCSFAMWMIFSGICNCCYFMVCAVVLEVGSDASAAWSWLLCGLAFSNDWCFCGVEIRSAIALGSFIPRTNNMKIPEAILHCFPLCALVSCNTIP